MTAFSILPDGEPSRDWLSKAAAAIILISHESGDPDERAAQQLEEALFWDVAEDDVADFFIDDMLTIHERHVAGWFLSVMTAIRVAGAAGALVGFLIAGAAGFVFYLISQMMVREEVDHV